MAYRDDRHALELRREELQKELADVEARLDGSSRRGLELENVRIASPCHMSWDGMTGNDTVRFCHACEKHVYDLSAMTRADAERLLYEREGLCLRLYRRADGTVLTSDCQVGARSRRTQRTALAVALAVGAATATCTGATLVQVGKGPARPGTRGGAPTQQVSPHLNVDDLGFYAMGMESGAPSAERGGVEGLHLKGETNPVRRAPPAPPKR
jgi:hypothetical protein